MSLQNYFRHSTFGRLQMKLNFVYLDCVAFFLINFHSTTAKISFNYSQQVTCFHVLNLFSCNTTLRLIWRDPIYKILILTSEGFPATHTPYSCSTLAWGQWQRPVSCVEVGTIAFWLLAVVLAQHSCSYLTRDSGLLWGRFKEISETSFFMCSVFLLKNKVGGLQGFVF